MAKGKKDDDTETLADRSIRSMRAALKRKVPNRIEHHLVLNYEAADRVLECRKAANLAVMAAERTGLPREEWPANHVAKVDETQAELDRVLAELEDDTFTVWFKALGGEAMEDLMDEHRPTRAQQDELRRQLLEQGLPANERLQYNSDTFPPAIISACSVDPVIPLDEAEEFWTSDVISRGERAAMLEAAYKVNDIVR